ncbi:MAG: exosortase/archaeosortase family protein [Pseudomonadota bacterium]
MRRLRAWQQAILLVVFALMAWIAFQPMLLALHGHWTTANDIDAGYLLLAVTLVAFALAPPRLGSPSNLLAIAFVGSIALASLFSIAATKSVALALLVGAFPLLVGALGGWSALPRAAHAGAILLMGTPIWFVLTPMLQGLTAAAVAQIFSMLTLPVFIDGNLIALPSGQLEIAAGCAGLKFVQTAIALMLIEGYLSGRRLSSVAIWVLVGALVAIVTNWIRVALITVLALRLGTAHPLILDHNWIGWLLFALAFFPLLLRMPAGPASGVADGAISDSETHPPRALSWPRAVLLLLAGLGVAMGLSRLSAGDAARDVAASQVAAVRELCVDSQHPLPATFVSAPLVLDCRLGDDLWLSLRGYLVERQGAELINPANRFLPGLAMDDYVVTQAGGDAAPVVVASDGMRVAFGYLTGGRWTGSAARFKLASLWRPFRPGPVLALILTERGSRARIGLDESAESEQAPLLTREFGRVQRAIARGSQE